MVCGNVRIAGYLCVADGNTVAGDRCPPLPCGMRSGPLPEGCKEGDTACSGPSQGRRRADRPEAVPVRNRTSRRLRGALGLPPARLPASILFRSAWLHLDSLLPSIYYATHTMQHTHDLP